MSPDDDGFLAELGRRNMFRIATGYVVVSWLALQVADVLLPAFGLADTWIRWLLGALLVAFPVVLAFSWFFEITPEGLRLERDVERPEPIARATGRRLDRLIIGVLSVAVVFFAVDRFIWGGAAPAEDVSGQPSIAVLPFADMSEARDQEWFSDGISEELLNLLARIPELRVIGRTSAFQFRGQGLDLRQVADTLGVGYLLEGSVRRVGNDLRISAALIDGSDGSELWTDRYDRSAGDVFRVQDEIASAVVAELRVTLLGEELARPEPASTEAHDLFLQGRYFADRRSPEGMARAIDLLTRSIELDPGYAPAWGKRGAVYHNLTLVGALPADSGVALSRSDIARALELDPDDPLNLTRHAATLATGEWRWDEARELMLRARAAAPGDPSVLGNVSIFQVSVGEVEDALRLAGETADLDPLNPLAHGNLAFALYYAGDHGRAEASWRRALDFVPDDPFLTYRVSNALLLGGDAEGALAVVQPLGTSQWGAAALPLIYHALGRTSDSEAALTALARDYGDINPVAVAEAHAFRGEADEAFAWLARAIERRAVRMAYVKGNPLLRSLEDDPRHRAVLERVGLPLD